MSCPGAASINARASGSASAKPGALQQDVRVDPVVDLRRLQFVRVLRWQPHEKAASKGAS